MTRLKASLIREMEKKYTHVMQAYTFAKSRFGDKFPSRIGGSDGRMFTRAEIEDDLTTLAITRHNALPCQTILFSAAQGGVFWDLIAKGGIPSLEYRLPFQDVLLEFTQPITVNAPEGKRSLLGMILNQIDADKDYYEQQADLIRDADKKMGFAETRIIPVDWSKSNSVQVNRITFIDTDFFVETLAWTSQADYADIDEDVPSDLLDWRMQFKKLAIACIGYINCENVYLHREDVPEVINAKRERKGKSRLEPYYVCRIRGVQYDGNDETGTGQAHSIRYDVRGHFRRLTNGKTTWVRAHQRGLQNELYVPKTYVVNKGAKGA